MRLRTVSKRRSSIVVRRYKVTSYDYCATPLKTGIVLTLTVTEDGNTQADCIRFFIPKRHMVTLVSEPGKKYFYKMKWKLGRVRYKVHVNKLSFVSGMFQFSQDVQIRHLIKDYQGQR